MNFLCIKLIYFTNYFTLNKEIHGHNNRSASNIYMDYRRTNHGKFSFKFREAQIRNELPKELRILQSYNSCTKVNKIMYKIKCNTC